MSFSRGATLRGALVVTLLVAAALRILWLDQLPPGLYRDEAFNGLDALGVLKGEHAFFFAANNGREPGYIYLVALFVALLGRTVLAIRLPAALAGVVTTAITYRLGRSWFGPRTGVLAAWLWAVTLWPVHLSRIGFRPILLPPLLGLVLLVATRASHEDHSRRRTLLWLVAGALYGATFYSYLAARFTLILLVAFLSYLFLTRRLDWERLRTGAPAVALAAGVGLLPLALLFVEQPDLLIGRAAQVSIFSETVNGGALLETLGRHIVRGLGLFLWRGDTILRHNPAGRPVFDLFMAIPFLVGLAWCLRHWRRPAAAFLLLWQAIMLGPTVLAEDAPHFLRAAGLLPGVVLLPALGLSNLWDWPKLAGALRRGPVLVLGVSTLIMTISDYAVYARRPDTAYLFEAAARTMAEQLAAEERGVHVYVDRRYWEGWPSLRFLIDSDVRLLAADTVAGEARDAGSVLLFSSEDGLPQSMPLPLSVYAWPYGNLDFVPEAVGRPAVVAADPGPLARGDLEETAYALYVRYAAEPLPRPDRSAEQPVARFDDEIWLTNAVVEMTAPDLLRVDLFWSGRAASARPLAAFVHVLVDGRSVAQSDGPPASGYWPAAWFAPDLVVRDRHRIELGEPFTAQHQIVVGLYDADTRVRLPVTDPAGRPAGDNWPLDMEPFPHQES